MKMNLYGVVYNNCDAVPGYSNKIMETLVVVEAGNIQGAEDKADNIMIEKEMNIEDIWTIGRTDIITDKEAYLKHYEKMDNIYYEKSVI